MEIWCNQFASEVLVPSNELKEFISGYPQIHDSELVEMIAANFAVSRLCAIVCLARFRDVKWSDRPNFFADPPKEKSEKQSKEGGGPDRTKVLASKLPFMLKLIFRT